MKRRVFDRKIQIETRKIIAAAHARFGAVQEAQINQSSGAEFKALKARAPQHDMLSRKSVRGRFGSRRIPSSARPKAIKKYIGTKVIQEYVEKERSARGTKTREHGGPGIRKKRSTP